jgi:hypothetical protein
MPIAEKPQMECILDKRVGKKTRRKEYFEYLVKWKNHPVEDASWENEAVIQKHGQTVWELMDRGPWKFSSWGVWCRSITNTQSEHGASACVFFNTCHITLETFEMEAPNL